jgi:ankyrin repeat protein
VAASYGNVECAKVLVKAGVDVNHTDIEGHTALHRAILKKHATIVQLLLQHGATVVMNRVVRTTRCSNGTRCCSSVTALMMCTDTDTVKVLLAAGADAHVTNNAGDTCMHVAARHNSSAAQLCLLIKAGADLKAVNRNGKTAAQIARDGGYTLIEQLLNRAAQQGH